MTILLLVIIYAVFISLGLPDGLLGSAWPAIRESLGVPLEFGGYITLVVTVMTIVSSLATSFLVRKLGVGLLLTASTALTVLSLFGFSQTSQVAMLFLLAIPLGLGAGAIDSALNNYVAKQYGPHHMNWLHAFWGVGATLGPIVFAGSLLATNDWHSGYAHLGFIQLGIVVLLLLSLPLWKVVKVKQSPFRIFKKVSGITYASLLKEHKVRYTFILFLFYTGIEVGVGLWLASYLVAIQGLSPGTASLWAGLYYGAITVGRLLAGFVSFKFSETHMIRVGLLLGLLGGGLLALGIAPALSIAGIVLLGLGFAPIYPGLIHITPARFGGEESPKVMSLQMVGGYIGASVIPPVIGLLSGAINLHVFIVTTVLVLVGVFVFTEILNKRAPVKRT